MPVVARHFVARFGRATTQRQLRRSPQHLGPSHIRELRVLLDRATLKGLTGVYVVVEDFDDQETRAGFDKRTFQTDVELKLGLAGIKVLSETEYLETPGAPSLYVVVTPLHERRGEYAAFSGMIELAQLVRLERDRSIGHSVGTWSKGWVGVADIPVIRESVKDGVDIFINAWLRMNPKPQESDP